MTVKEYALVNVETNIVENTVLWDGNQASWTPPSGYQAVDELAFPYMVWVWDNQQNDWVLAEETNRMDGDVMNSLFNGSEFITAQPKPDPIEQPKAAGDIQTL